MRSLYICIILLLLSVSRFAMAQSPDPDSAALRKADSTDPEIVKKKAAGRALFHGRSGSIARRGSRGIGSPGIMHGKLFTPHLIMRNRESLNLTPEQEDAIKEEMRRFQGGVVDIQWELNAAQSDLEKELDNDRIDADRALALLDAVMKAENDLKRSHMTLLIRIRNALDAEQISELEKLAPFHLGRFHPAMPERRILRKGREVHQGNRP